MFSRALMIALILMVAAGTLLTILQIWTDIVGWDLYVKAMITFAVLGTGAGLLMMIVSDLGRRKKMKDEGYLD